MNKFFTALTLACFALSASDYANAQALRLPGRGGSGSGSVTAEQLLQKYTEASIHTYNAYSELFDAVGMKEMADELKVKAKNLTEGTLSSASMEDIQQTITKSAEELQRKFLADSEAPTEAQRQHIVEAIGHLVPATAATVETAMLSRDFRPGTNPASLTDMARLAVNVGRSLPGDASRLKGIIGLVIEYRKSHNLPDDPRLADATSLLNF